MVIVRPDRTKQELPGVIQGIETQRRVVNGQLQKINKQ